jgi:uncharacterized protein (DUF302 family)
MNGKLREFVRQSGLVLAAALAILPALVQTAAAAEVMVTPVKYEVNLDDKLPAVRELLVSALESRNYAIINVLNVQEGLKARGIDAPALQLIEFCNLTLAYTITSNVPDFEMFAPCRVALIEKDGKTSVRVLRPAFVLSILSANPKLSAEGKASLEKFDRDLKEIFDELAKGGF